MWAPPTPARDQPSLDPANEDMALDISIAG